MTISEIIVQRHLRFMHMIIWRSCRCKLSPGAGRSFETQTEDQAISLLSAGRVRTPGDSAQSSGLLSDANYCDTDRSRNSVMRDAGPISGAGTNALRQVLKINRGILVNLDFVMIQIESYDAKQLIR